MRLYTVNNYIIRYETNIIMIKYNNQLSFNVIVHTIQLNTIVGTWAIGERSLNDL